MLKREVVLSNLGFISIPIARRAYLLDHTQIALELFKILLGLVERASQQLAISVRVNLTDICPVSIWEKWMVAKS